MFERGDFEFTMKQPKEYTEAQVCEAVRGSLGIMSTVAKNLNCTWGTARTYIEKYPEAKQLWEDEKERVLDLAESKVFKSINLDDVGAAKWLLSNRGRDRGYGETLKVEQSGKLNVGIEFGELTPDQAEKILETIRGK